jgi:K+-transporting ATPase ATPase C chain
MTAIFRPVSVLLLVFTALLGFVYPLAVTGIAQFAFPKQANGSIITVENRRVGSALIGQPFTRPEFFWSRPSATTPWPYNAAASAGSNLGPLNPALRDAVATRVAVLRAADPGNTEEVPIDLVTASASGLDPHISPHAAYYQVGRVARARGLPEKAVRQLVDDHVEGDQPYLRLLLGEPRVNLLTLNLALIKIAKDRVR